MKLSLKLYFEISKVGENIRINKERNDNIIIFKRILKMTENKFLSNKLFCISRKITLIYNKIYIKYNDVKNGFYCKISLNISYLF